MPIQNPDPKTVPATVDIIANRNIRVKGADGSMKVVRKGEKMEGVQAEIAARMNVGGACRVFKPGSVPKAAEGPEEDDKPRSAAKKKAAKAPSAEGDKAA